MANKRQVQGSFSELYPNGLLYISHDMSHVVIHPVGYPTQYSQQPAYSYAITIGFEQYPFSHPGQIPPPAQEHIRSLEKPLREWKDSI